MCICWPFYITVIELWYLGSLRRYFLISVFLLIPSLHLDRDTYKDRTNESDAKKSVTVYEGWSSDPLRMKIGNIKKNNKHINDGVSTWSYTERAYKVVLYSATAWSD